MTHRVSGWWLDASEIRRVFDMLEQGGHQALAVGGCVRDALLGGAVNDVDISTDARPERVMELARLAGIRAVPTGIEHGTVTVISDAIPCEITTWRRDVETDGRRAVVAFATRIEDDAMRRDFTMNALYADRSGLVIDPLGSGIKDAVAGRLRFIGEAEDRIREDYLRILRFFRFYAFYGDPDQGIDQDGFAACAAHLEGIETLSRERIGAEMMRLLSAPDPAPALASMQAAGVLSQVLPGADARHVARLVHLENGSPPAWQGRLAVLGGENPGEAWRLSRKATSDQQSLRDAIGSGQSAAVLGHRLGAEHARLALLARAVLLESPLPEGWQAEAARGAQSQFPIRAADLPDLTGPALGARLKALEAAWLASDLRSGKDALLALP